MQLAQAVAPVPVWYWPATHAAHADKLVDAAYWPAAHSTQLDAPAPDATLPAVQPTHTMAAEIEE